MSKPRNKLDIDVNSMFSAVCEGKVETVRKLINCYGLSHSKWWSDGYCLLRDALKCEQTEVAKLLLRSGAKLNSTFHEPCTTPLHLAVKNGDIEIIKMTLGRGADIDAKDDHGQTPLYNAIRDGQTSVAKLLLTSGAKLNSTFHMPCPTPLHLAAKNGDIEIIRMIIDRRADINAKDHHGQTPLHNAIADNKVEVAQFLLEHGVRVNNHDNQGMAALHVAVKTGCLPMVKQLLKYGANVSSVCKNGYTPLHIASQKRHLDVVVTLLEYGSDINTTCRTYNFTPLDYAMKDNLSSVERPVGLCFSQWKSKGEQLRRLVAKTLLRHTIQIKTANLYVSEKNIGYVTKTNLRDDDIRVFQQHCEYEIASMKIENITNHNISFYDILGKRTRSAVYMRNDNIVQALKSGEYKEKFPIYAKMIESQFRRDIERRELQEQGINNFHILYPELPYDCTEKIFSYLSVEDLSILLNACT